MLDGADAEGEFAVDVHVCESLGRFWLHRPVGHGAAVLARPRHCRSRRRRLWEAASVCFHPSVLSRSVRGELPVEFLHCLRFIFQYYHGLLFSTRPVDTPKYLDPPPELFERISINDFCSQYIRLRAQFVPHLLQDVRAAECFRVVGIELFTDGGMPIQVSPSDVMLEADPTCPTDVDADMSVSLGRDSAVGCLVKITNKRHPLAGAVAKIARFHKAVVEDKFYQLLMTASYEDVRKHTVWHVLRAYHRLMMAGGTTEALAESVCSSLTLQTRGGWGRKPVLGDILNAVRLRCFGVHGDGQDMNFIARSLDIFFRGKPWHFVVNKRTEQQRTAAHVLHTRWVSPAVERYRRSIRVGSQFSWLASTLREVAMHSARRDISIVIDGASGTEEARAELVRNPKAGLILRGLHSSAEVHEALLTMIRAAEPHRFDERVWPLTPTFSY